MIEFELPFQTEKRRRPNPYGGRPIVEQHVSIEAITEEMAVPTKAIADRALKIQPILPVVDSAAPPTSS